MNRHLATLIKSLKFRKEMKKLRKADFLFIFLIFESMLLVGAHELPGFGTSWVNYTDLLVIYMLMSLAFFVYSGEKMAHLKKMDFAPSLRWLIQGFLIGWIVVLLFAIITGVSVSTVVQDNAFMILVWHFIVAGNEELIFRDIASKALGDVPSISLFALFHYAAYGWNPVAMVWAFIMGAVFLWAYKRTKNLAFPIGLHWAYNGVMSGVLIGNFA